LFDPHTAIIRRQQAGKPVEFGHKVWLDQVDCGIVTRWSVLEGNPHQTVSNGSPLSTTTLRCSRSHLTWPAEIADSIHPIMLYRAWQQTCSRATVLLRHLASAYSASRCELLSSTNSLSS
jgi:hypothetical protein